MVIINEVNVRKYFENQAAKLWYISMDMLKLMPKHQQYNHL